MPIQAADIVRMVGIGRNEYIATMNKCKAKKLLWRVNKAIVREHLPAEPLDIERQPWWIAHVVNLGARGGYWYQAGDTCMRQLCICASCRLGALKG